MSSKPNLLIVEPEAQVQKGLAPVLEPYTVVWADDFKNACIRFCCGERCWAAIIIEGGRWPTDLLDDQDFINYIRGMGYLGPVVIIATDPAFPYEVRLRNVDYAVRIGELTKKLSEILAKKK